MIRVYIALKNHFTCEKKIFYDNPKFRYNKKCELIEMRQLYLKIQSI